MVRLINWDDIEPLAESFNDYSEWENLRHLQRIKYFMINGWDEPIEINFIYAYNLPITLSITDGNHRFLAAVALNTKKIETFYSGYDDMLQYLLGNTDDFSFERELDDYDSFKEHLISLVERWERPNIKNRFSVKERINYCFLEIQMMCDNFKSRGEFLI